MPAVNALYLAAFLSGAASLMYQLAWTRRLMTTTSATAAAQALVVGVFLAGLGIGGWWAGRIAPRIKRPIRFYAAVEMGAAACAGFSIPAIDACQTAGDLARIVGLPGSASLALTLILASAFLLAVAVLLGASLPLFIAERERADRAPRAIAFLYGWNTFGAALGALLAGFVTIGRFGLRATTWMGTGAALAAAAVALAASSRKAPQPAAPPSPDRPGRLPLRPALASGLAGFVGIGVEIVDTRLLALLFKNTVYVFAAVLVAVLIGIVLGAATAGVLARASNKSGWFASVVSLAAAAVLVALVPSALPDLAASEVLNVSIAPALASGSAVFVLVVAIFIAPPLALSSLVLPLATASLRASSDARSFGQLYAANALGSVLGSFMAGFVFLPAFGVSAAVTFLALTALLACLFLCAGRGALLERARRRRALEIVGAAGIAVALLHFGRDLPRRIYEARLPPSVKILEFAEGTVSDVMVTEDPYKRRRLWINSAWVAGTGGGHRVLGLLPGLFVDHPKRALGIALGTGQTFAAVLRHGFESLDCVEINPQVIALSARWFKEANGALFDKPNVHIHQDDGRSFLRTTEDRFDLIVLEPLQAWTAGTSALYSREFYASAQRVLASGGVVAQWIPFYGQSAADTRAMIRAGVEVFKEASLWLDENDGILLLSDAPFALDPLAIYARAKARKIDPLLFENSIASPADLYALLLFGTKGAKAWASGAPLLDDDHPFLEFDAAESLFLGNAREIFESARAVREEPETAMTQTSTEAGAVLEIARSVRSALLDVGTVPIGDFAARAEILERGLEKAPSSSLLVARYTKLMRGWANASGEGSREAASIRARADRVLSRARGEVR